MVLRGFRGFLRVLDCMGRNKQIKPILVLFIFTVPLVCVFQSTKVFPNNSSAYSDQTAIESRNDDDWQKTLGAGNGYCVDQTSDEGYIITGDRSGDVLLIKTDESGNKVWEETYGGISSDRGWYVQQTNDEGYIIVGEIEYDDVWLIKTDENGTKEWDRRFGGDFHDSGLCVQQTVDGGYVLIGDTQSYGLGHSGSSDLWLIKTDESGNKVWDKTYGGDDWDKGYCVKQTSDGGYILGGVTELYGSGGRDGWLIKTDENGAIIWHQTYGGSSYEECFYFDQTSDGGYVITGYGPENRNVWLVKTDENGNELWSKNYGGNLDDMGHCVEQTTDGGYIIVGHSNSFSAREDEDIWLIKTNSTGDFEWHQMYGGPGWDRGYSVMQINDGGYILTGSFAGVCLIKAPAFGDPNFPIEPETTSVSTPNDGSGFSSRFSVLWLSIVFLYFAIFIIVSAKWDKIRMVKKYFYTLPCPICGAFVKRSAISCKNCGEKFQTCIVCNFSILESLVETPCCQSFAHRSHLKEWLKIKGKCPNCGEKLEEWEIP